LACNQDGCCLPGCIGKLLLVPMSYWYSNFKNLIAFGGSVKRFMERQGLHSIICQGLNSRTCIPGPLKVSAE
jgi:hypothetical protein